jgi:hypothetical protein
MIKWARRNETPTRYEATIHRKGVAGIFTVDVTTRQNRFVNHLDLYANVLFPSRTGKIEALKQVAPGKYRCAFPAEETGEYYFSIYEQGSGSSAPPQLFGFGLPYTDEFVSTGVNYDLLSRLASATGGRVIEPDTIPDELFTVTSGFKEDGIFLWPLVTIVFLVCLIVDAALRKFLNFDAVQ